MERRYIIVSGKWSRNNTFVFKVLLPPSVISPAISPSPPRPPSYDKEDLSVYDGARHQFILEHDYCKDMPLTILL